MSVTFKEVDKSFIPSFDGPAGAIDVARHSPKLRSVVIAVAKLPLQVGVTLSVAQMAACVIRGNALSLLAKGTLLSTNNGVTDALLSIFTLKVIEASIDYIFSKPLEEFLPTLRPSN